MSGETPDLEALEAAHAAAKAAWMEAEREAVESGRKMRAAREVAAQTSMALMKAAAAAKGFAPGALVAMTFKGWGGLEDREELRTFLGVFPGSYGFEAEVHVALPKKDGSPGKRLKGRLRDLNLLRLVTPAPAA